MVGVPPPARAFVRPDRAFEEWRPSLRQAVAAVVLLALVNAVGMSIGASAVAGAVSGTVQVDNPARPSETTCEMYQDDSRFPDSEMADSLHEDCRTEPKTVPQSLGSTAEQATSSLPLAAGLGTLVWWVVVAAVFALVIPSDRGEFRRLLAIAGWGLLPAAVRYGARPVIVGQAAQSWNHPGTIDALQPATRAFVLGTDVELFGGVVAVTLLWQAVIYTYGLSTIETVSVRRSAIVACGVVAVPLSLGLGGIHPPSTDVAGLSLILIVIGVPGVIALYTLTRMGEQLDAIGSTRRLRDVEPAAWNVWLTRAAGTGLLVGAVWILGGPLLV